MGKKMGCIRWILVPLAAFVGGWILSFPIHFFLISAGYGEVKLPIGTTQVSLDVFLHGFLETLGFVLVGAWMAPSSKAYSAFGLAFFVLGAGLIFRIMGAHWIREYNFWQPASIAPTLVGAAAAMSIVALQERKKRKPPRRSAKAARGASTSVKRKKRRRS